MGLPMMQPWFGGESPIPEVRQGMIKADRDRGMPIETIMAKYDARTGEIRSDYNPKEHPQHPPRPVCPKCHGLGYL
jgi:hypothetical protein